MSRKKSVSISPFLDDEGKIIKIPSPNRTKIPLLEYLAGKFTVGKMYSEKEVNQIIDKWHTFKDYFILRRLLVDYNFLKRTPNGEKYWVNDDEKEDRV
ncbi:MAG: DUF2087 domain-containing protein [Eubacteriales bacterium]